MLQSIEDKTRRELVEIVKIQMEAYQKLDKRIADGLEREEGMGVVICELEEQNAELRKERDELKEENLALQSYVFKSIAFVTRAVEKLRGIPEFKPTGVILNRVLRMTPKTALQAHNLEQQAKGLEDFYPDTNILKDRKSIQLALKDSHYKLRNQAKTLRDK